MRDTSPSYRIRRAITRDGWLLYRNDILVFSTSKALAEHDTPLETKVRRKYEMIDLYFAATKTTTSLSEVKERKFADDYKKLKKLNDKSIETLDKSFKRSQIPDLKLT